MLSRRSKLSKAAKTARNLAIADAALALVRDRIARKLPGVKPRRRWPSVKALALGGVAAAGTAAALLKRDKITGMMARSTADVPSAPPAPSPPPGPSNYDVSGPVANTATPVPAPEGAAPPAIDEAAEEAAAAAEAANIGGTVSDYAATQPDLAAPPSEQPLAEAGAGESEGQEQAEAELAQAAQPTAPGMSDEQRQIEDAIQAAGNPVAPERVEPLASTAGPSPGDAEQRAAEAAASADSAAEEAARLRAEAGPAAPADQPPSSASDEPPAEPPSPAPAATSDEPSAGQPAAEGEDEGAEWRTWSGRRINP
jgi:hypothetical protein